MFSWLNLSNLQTCDLNDSMVDWLGVERESLSTECAYKLQVSKSEKKLASKDNDRRNFNLGYKTTK